MPAAPLDGAPAEPEPLACPTEKDLVPATPGAAKMGTDTILEGQNGVCPPFSPARRAGAIAPGARLRIGLLAAPLLALFGLLALRLVQIQLWQGERWSEAAERQRFACERRPAPRGEIRGADGTLLVRSLPRKIVIADLKILEDPAGAAQALAPLLGKKPEDLAARMKRDDRRVVYLAREIEPETAQQVAALKIRGIGFEDSFRRGYLWGSLACHVVGWANSDSGQEGLELFLDPLLRGIPGYRVYERDAARRPISRGDERSYTPPERAPRAGLSVTLTIDPAIQFVAEEELARLCQQFQPAGATVTVMDVRTGAILALAGLPRYDPNEPT
jgi:cell division protein FtsI (penicillin-binding protein 3)